MTRATLLLAGLLAVLLAAPGAVGPTVAQDTTTAENATDGDETRDVVAQVDDSVVVTSYRYNASSETFYVTLENRGGSATDVTITEIINRDEAGDRRFGVEVVSVDGGETVEAAVSASRVDGAAGVMVLTSEAVETGSGVYLQESSQTDNRLIKGDPDGSHVRSAAASTGLGTAVLMFLGAWQYVATRNRDVQEPNLDPSITLLGRFRRWRR